MSPIIILGEEGTGKSALIRQIIDESSGAFTVLRISGDETHGGAAHKAARTPRCLFKVILMPFPVPQTAIPG